MGHLPWNKCSCRFPGKQIDFLFFKQSAVKSVKDNIWKRVESGIMTNRWENNMGCLGRVTNQNVQIMHRIGREDTVAGITTVVANH